MPLITKQKLAALDLNFQNLREAKKLFGKNLRVRKWGKGMGVSILLHLEETYLSAGVNLPLPPYDKIELQKLAVRELKFQINSYLN